MTPSATAPVPGLQPAMPASNDWAPGFAADFMAKDLDFALRAAEVKPAFLLLIYPSTEIRSAR